MPDIPQNFPRARRAAVCAVCGRRPGTLRMVVATQSGPTQVALCERCARELMAPRRRDGPADPQTRAVTASPQSDDPRARRVRPRPDRRRRATAASTRSSAAPSEIEQTVEILARRRKNNAVLIGEAGVGKTAIAEGLALRIAAGRRARDARAAPRIVALDLAGMVAGAQFRGQFEQRLRPRSRRSSSPRAGSSCSSTSCTRCSAPATPRARWTPPTCSSRCSPAASCA